MVSVARPAISWARAASARGEFSETLTSTVACLAMSASLLLKEVAASEKPSGMVTTAE